MNLESLKAISMSMELDINELKIKSSNGVCTLRDLIIGLAQVAEDNRLLTQRVEALENKLEQSK